MVPLLAWRLGRQSHVTAPIPPVTDTADAADATVPAYGSFPRRFQAFAIDTAIVLTGIVVIAIASDLAQEVPGSGRVAVIALVAVVVLYEPVLVARYGSTIGHRAVNLRVVDDATGGNPSFLRALARFVIKGVIGILSFTTMALTRRHQAIHDSVTRTTVQIRDLSRARPIDFQLEREAVPDGLLPSRTRRVAVIIGYLVLLLIALAFTSGLFLSDACVNAGRCTSGEDLASQVFGVGWLALSVLTIIAGWRGRLPGGRARGSVAASDRPDDRPIFPSR